MALYKMYAERKPIGVFPLSNWGGLAILAYCDKDGDLGAVACFDFGESRQQIRRHKIYTTPAGRLYIRKQGRRYYFDEIMRV